MRPAPPPLATVAERERETGGRTTTVNCPTHNHYYVNEPSPYTLHRYANNCSESSTPPLQHCTATLSMAGPICIALKGSHNHIMETWWPGVKWNSGDDPIQLDPNQTTTDPETALALITGLHFIDRFTNSAVSFKAVSKLNYRSLQLHTAV